MVPGRPVIRQGAGQAAGGSCQISATSYQLEEMLHSWSAPGGCQTGIAIVPPGNGDEIDGSGCPGLERLVPHRGGRYVLVRRAGCVAMRRYRSSVHFNWQLAA